MAPLPLPDPPLSDGTIALREKAEADIPALVAAVQDPLIPRYTRIPSPYGERQAREFLVEQRRRREEGTGLSLLVVDPDGDDLLGSVGALVDRDSARAEIGYWVAREARGRGVASRAVVLLGGWLFEALGLARLQIHTETDNVASQRVAEHAGFTREGVLRSYELIEGRPINVVMFAALPGELISRTRSSATRGSPSP
jgi:RimJ/RimL family protein N-acetyltransferase